MKTHTLHLVFWLAALLAGPVFAQSYKTPSGRLALLTPDITKVLRLGSQDRAFLELTGPFDGQLTYELESFEGIVTTQRRSVALTRDEIKRIQFPTAVYDRSGINWVRAKVEADESALEEMSASFAVIDSAWSRGAIAYTWFSLHDHPNVDSPTKPGFTYGLCTSFRKVDPDQSWNWENMDYDAACPKAAYVAMNTVTSVLHGARFVQQIELGPECYVFHFRGRDQNDLYVMWRETRDAETFHTVFQSAQDLRRVDLMGNVEPVKVRQRKAVVSVGGEPIFLCGPVGAAAEFIEAKGIGTQPASAGTIRVAEGGLPPEPQIRLDAITQVVNLSEHDPHTAHRLWQGPQDLSADVKIGRNGGRWIMEVNVKDDHFDWSHSELQQLDRIELAIKPDGVTGYWFIHITGDPNAGRGTKSASVSVKSVKGAPFVSSEAIHVSGKGGGHRRMYRVEIDGNAFNCTDQASINVAIWDVDGGEVCAWMEAVPGMKQLREGNDTSTAWLKVVSQ